MTRADLIAAWGDVAGAAHLLGHALAGCDLMLAETRTPQGYFRNRVVPWLRACARGADAGDRVLADALDGFQRIMGDDAIAAFVLRKLGVRWPMIVGAGHMVGVARAEGFDSDGTFQLLPFGERVGRRVLTVATVIWGGPLSAVAEGIDIAALPITAGGVPKGGARQMLGLCPVLAGDPLAFDLDGWPAGRTIRLYDDPWDWLRAGAKPATFCVLDWDAHEARLLIDLADRGDIMIVADSDAHARALMRRIRPPRQAVKMQVAA